MEKSSPLSLRRRHRSRLVSSNPSRRDWRNDGKDPGVGWSYGELALRDVGGAIPRILRLTLGPTNVTGSTDVGTFGYPFTAPRKHDDGRTTWHLEARWLEGYITRVFTYDHPKIGGTPSYEVDMQAPRGLSGAPLIELGAGKGGHGVVVGVVYGANDVAMIEHTEWVDPETGARDTLRELHGRATDMRPLAEHLAELPPEEL